LIQIIGMLLKDLTSLAPGTLVDRIVAGPRHRAGPEVGDRRCQRFWIAGIEQDDLCPADRMWWAMVRATLSAPTKPIRISD
jgi:hypothetical protein